jgi:hypothetical protein
MPRLTIVREPLRKPQSVNGLESGSMTPEEALLIADALVFAKTYKHLSTLQVAIFRGAWFNLKYDHIAKRCHCSEIHIKMSGSGLWDLLSQALEEKVTKKTFRAALERQKWQMKIGA